MSRYMRFCVHCGHFTFAEICEYCNDPTQPYGVNPRPRPVNYEEENMKSIEITVYGKRCSTIDGKRHFTRYFGRLPGEMENTSIKFQKDCGEPPEVPCVLILERGGCNRSMEKFTSAAGEVIRRPVLWISAWKLADHSPDDGMDDYFGE